MFTFIHRRREEAQPQILSPSSKTEPVKLLNSRTGEELQVNRNKKGKVQESVALRLENELLRKQLTSLRDQYSQENKISPNFKYQPSNTTNIPSISTKKTSPPLTSSSSSSSVLRRNDQITKKNGNTTDFVTLLAQSASDGPTFAPQQSFTGQSPATPSPANSSSLQNNKKNINTSITGRGDSDRKSRPCVLLPPNSPFQPQPSQVLLRPFLTRLLLS